MVKHTDEQLGRSHNRYGDKTRKRGRREMRTIKRTTNRTILDTDEVSTDHTGKDDVVNAASGASDVDVDIEDDVQKKEKVYGALLTILKSEHPELKKKKVKLEKVEATESKLETAHRSDDEDQSSDEEEDENDQIEKSLDPRAVKHDEEDDGELNDDENDSEDEEDPFELHFNKKTEKSVNQLDSAFKQREVKYKSLKTTITETEYSLYSKPTIVTDLESATVEPLSKKSSIHPYLLKQRLKMHNKLMDDKENTLTEEQKKLVDPMFQYKDILYEFDDYGKPEDEYRDLYVLHVLNHIYKTRDRILKDNQRLQNNPDVEYLDQGFTRPKVLIVVPTRDTGYYIVDKLINKSGIDQVDKKGKFRDQFFDDATVPSNKPKSFQQIFKGNTSDFFVLGMKFTRKTIKLYSNFYQSDIIVCTPLGLQMIVENTDKKKRQDDFLSSIEITILDQFNLMEYQNISHVYTIFEHLNKIPDEQHDADFSRIRMWYINDQAKLFRQNMIFTRYTTPNANSIINSKCKNWAGRWKNHRIVTPENSCIGQLGLKIKQIFQRFDTIGGSVVDEPDYRFKYFTSVIIPSIVKSTSYEDGILIYIPDYTDYLRIRNHLKDKTTLIFGEINEYTETRQLNANRSLFQLGRVKLMLYTERLHHFRRYELRGVKSVFFYQPPSNPEFYNEVIRYIGKNAFLGNVDLNIATVRTLYSKMDGLSLERVVGSKRAGILTHGQNETYEFK